MNQKSGLNHVAVWLSITLLCAVISSPARPVGRRVAVINTLAGDGNAGYSGDGGPAGQARINNPFGLVRGPDGALYFCDTFNHSIRKITPGGIIITVAGTGQSGYSGDGGPARQARLNEPYEVRFDRRRNLYFVERLNHVVRRVDVRDGVISTVAGAGTAGFSGDGGPATRAVLSQPHSLQFDRAGFLYICDIGNHRIRRIDPNTGVIVTFAGTGVRAPTPDGAPLSGTPLDGPRAIDFDRRGDLWLALREGNAVYRIDMKRRRLHHEAGTGKKGFTGNGGPPREATLSGPKGIAVAPNGDIYLADTESHSIRKIDRRRGTLELVAGTGEKGDGPEGNPVACRLSRPHGVYVDRDGSILIGDSEAHRVRIVR